MACKPWFDTKFLLYRLCSFNRLEHALRVAYWPEALGAEEVIEIELIMKVYYSFEKLGAIAKEWCST